MTIGSIIIKNIKGNLNKYVMYYLSNVIVVTIFFLFANFACNPALSNVTKEGSAGEFIAQVMYLCEFVIVIFTVIFAGYSISNFLKSREKEFGPLSMFGLTKSQIRRYVIIENVIISSVSIITGLFFGILFSKLFYLAVSAIIDLGGEVSFLISLRAIETTVVSFFIVLNFMSFIMSFKIKNSNIAQLLKGSRLPKKNPQFSRVKAILAIVLIAGGYIVAIKSKMYIVFTMIPVFIAVVIGTSLLFTQFSVYFTEKLKGSRHIFYKGINMITLSQIIYKLKDNAKVMFITSILSGVTLATAVSVYSVEKVGLDSIELNMPNDISVVEQGIDTHEVISEGKIEEILNNHSFDIENKNQVNLVKLKNADNAENSKEKKVYSVQINTEEFYLMSLTDYNNIAEKYHRKKLNVNRGEAALYIYDLSANILNIGEDHNSDNIESVDLDCNDEIKSLKLIDKEKGGIINYMEDFVNTIIVSDDEFTEIYSSVPKEAQYVYYGYNIKNNRKAIEAAAEIRSNVSKDKVFFLNERITNLCGLIEILSIILFIGTFIAMIFFIATGSILYFKMFNEIQKDKFDFMGLKKIGVTRQELNKTISIQSFIMFFLPFAVATLHAVFAVKSVGVFYVKYFMFIEGVYLVLQTVFYIFSKWMYVKQINNWID